MLACASLCACSRFRATAEWQGAEPVLATYAVRTMEAHLPAGVRVPAVIAASSVVLTRQGYSISERSAYENRGVVIGEPGHGEWFEKIVVKADATRDGVKLRIRVDPTGDEITSRVLLDEILAELGM